MNILGRGVTLLVLQRIERVSEKVRAFLDRGEDRDAFDAYHFSVRGLAASEWSQMAGLVVRKINVDDDIATGTDLHSLFDGHILELETSWATKGGLVVMRGIPAWSCVRPHVHKFRTYVPATKK